MQEVFEYNKLKRLSIYSVAGLAEQKDKAKLLVFEDKTQEELLQMLSEFFNVKVEKIKSKTRKRDIVIVRHIFCYIARHMLHIQWRSIGLAVGGRDHTTAMHGEATAKDLLDSEDPVFCKAFNRFMKYCEPLTIKTFQDG